MRAPTEPPAKRHGRFADASVVVPIETRLVFHCGRPQKRQQSGTAALLMLLWSFLLKLDLFFIAEAHRGASKAALSLCRHKKKTKKKRKENEKKTESENDKKTTKKTKEKLKENDQKKTKEKR